MRLWGRALRSRTAALWLLLLGVALFSLALSDLLQLNLDRAGDRKPVPPRRPLLRLPGGGPDLELLVDSRDPALESLKEEQLLFVAASSANPRGPARRKAGYKVLLPGTNRENRATASPADGHRERTGSSGQDAELRALQRFGFDEALSERIPLRRALPDARHPECLEGRYSESLPAASVIICFHDESWSTLLRTVHSVLDTAHEPHLREVLLVDDLSQHGHLKGVLGEYVSHLSRVRLIRSTRRLGVGGCRALGASRAGGEVLVFMDSHCECQRGWLEPLLERVAQDSGFFCLRFSDKFSSTANLYYSRTRVVSPIIDLIDWRTFQYNATQWPVRGVFDWRLDFHWESSGLQPQKEEPGSAVEALRSPALGGEVVAVNRNFFHSIGGYDPGMVLWGEEQVELSIRVWSCGGSMEVVPCSRVAHLSRHHLPYRFPDQELLQRNKIRVADTWMEAHRKIFYQRDTLAHFIRQSENRDMTERMRLKRSLGCRSFHWYLTTVYPQLYIPQDRPGLSGELYNVGTGTCADSPWPQQGSAMTVALCSGTGSQHCELNSESELRWGPQGALCFDGRGEKVLLSPCPSQRPTASSLRWRFTKLSGQLLHLQSQLCLEAAQEGALPAGGGGGQLGGLFLRPCSRHPRQQWHFEQLVAPMGV